MKKNNGAVAPSWSVCFAILGLMSGVVHAEGMGTDSSYSGSIDSTKETMNKAASEQAGSVAQEATHIGQSVGDAEIKSEATKMTLAPHTLAVETSLMDAINQVKGLKAEVKVAQSQPTPEFVAQYKMHTRELKDALKSARTHEGQLKTKASKFPSVVQSEQFRQLDPAILDAERLSQQWEKQAGVAGYWRDNMKVTSDLDQLERRLQNALDKTKSLNSRMEVSEVG